MLEDALETDEHIITEERAETGSPRRRKVKRNPVEKFLLTIPPNFEAAENHGVMSLSFITGFIESKYGL